MADNFNTLDREWRDVGFDAVFGEVETPGTPESLEEAHAILSPHLYLAWLSGWNGAVAYKSAIREGRAFDGAG